MKIELEISQEKLDEISRFPSLVNETLPKLKEIAPPERSRFILLSLR